MLKRTILMTLLMAALSVWASGQSISTPTTNSADAAAARARTPLVDQLGTPVVEPVSQRFRMDIPFALATRKEVEPVVGAKGQQYIWDNFTEGFVMLQYTIYPAGTIPASAEARRQWAVERALNSFEKGGVQTVSEKDVQMGNILGRQYEATFHGRKTTIRVFADGDVYYTLSALPVTDHAGLAIERLFDSFQLVKP
jgi:hypothetical protein